jgi:predicted nucleic acid-binding protein
MARVVLDTSVLVAVDRNPELVEVLLKPDVEYFLPEIAVAEFLVGVELSGSDSQKLSKIAQLDAFENFVTPTSFGRAEAKAYSVLAAISRRTGTPRSSFDLAIAANAFVLDATLQTSDRAAKFEELPGIRVSYF